MLKKLKKKIIPATSKSYPKNDNKIKSGYFVDNCGKENFGTLDQLKAAIASNNHNHVVDKEILLRLIKFWKAMQKTPDDLPEEYHIGGQWLPIIKDSFGPLISALDNEDLDSLERLLNNFFRQFGDFFGEPTNYQSEEYIQQKLERFKIYSSRWMDLYGEDSLEEIIDPLIGNPVGFLINEKLYTPGADFS